MNFNFSGLRGTYASLFLAGSLCTLPCVPALAQDSDDDGIGDKVERLVGLNPNSKDSDGDGIRDIDEYLEFSITGGGAFGAKFGASAEHFLLNPGLDTDLDGIDDFTEIYGYYNDGNLLRGVRRSIPADTWSDMRNNSAHYVTLGGLTFRTVRWATRALEDAGKVTDRSGAKIINVDNMYNIIYNAVVAKMEDMGVSSPEYHQVVTGSATDEGTIASVMAAIMISGTAYEPSKQVFYTHPFRFSSDFDPYSDKYEAMGLFGSAKPRAGASHPLIGAMPQIVTSLESIVLYDMATVSETSGSESSEEITSLITEETNYTSESFWSVGINVTAGVEFSPTRVFSIGGEVNTEFGSNQAWTSNTVVETGLTTFNSSSQESSSEVSNSCFNAMQLKLNVTNVGSDAASLIKPVWDIHFGDEFWTSVEYADTGLNLAAGESDQITILGRNDDKACLNVAETDFVANGGIIGLGTDIVSAKLTMFNNDSGQLENSADWSALMNSFKTDLSRVILKGESASGNDFTRNIWLLGHEPSSVMPNMSLTIKDALDIAFEPISCGNIGGMNAALCYATEVGEFVIGAGDDIASSFEFTFYDADFNLIQDKDYIYSLESKNDSPHLWDKLLPPRTTVTVHSEISLSPRVTEFEVFQRYDSNGNAINEAEAYSLVNDQFGITKVEVCDGANCTALNAQMNTGGRTNHYAIKSLTTNNAERLVIKAENILGNVTELPASKLSPKFSAGTIQRLNFIRDYKTRVRGYLSDYESLGESRHEYYESADLMPDIDSLRVFEDELVTKAEALLEACQNFEQVTQCFQLLNAFESDYLLNSPVLFNVNKMPIRNILHTSKSGTLSGDDIVCEVPENSILVGITVGVTAGITEYYHEGAAEMKLHYREIKPTGKLTSPYFKFGSVETSCGSGSMEKTEKETRFINDQNYRSWAITNFGLDVDNRNVNRLCVGYHAVDLRDEGYLTNPDRYKSNCGATDTWNGIEEQTSSTPTTEHGLPHVIQVDSDRASAKLTKKRSYSKMEIGFIEPYNSNLVNGARYRIKNEYYGTYLDKRPGDNSIVELKSLGEDDLGQVWIIDAVNPREYRIKSASGGRYLKQPTSSGSKIYATEVSASDEDKASDFATHFRLIPDNGGHYIRSSFKVDNYLSGRDREFKGYLNRSTWIFERVSD